MRPFSGLVPSNGTEPCDHGRLALPIAQPRKAALSFSKARAASVPIYRAISSADQHKILARSWTYFVATNQNIPPEILHRKELPLV
jgi:hypothetical protein